VPTCEIVRGETPGAADEGEAAGGGEFFGARPAQEHVLGVLHHRARELDGIPDAGHAAHRARLQRGAVHDGGIELVASVEREHRPMSGIEKRVVLEHHDGARDRLQARPAALEHGESRGERRGEGGAIFRFPLGTHLRPRQGSRTAVNRQSEHRLNFFPWPLD
jgi:hypothetical protein